jgi:hypothetical protein
MAIGPMVFSTPSTTRPRSHLGRLESMAPPPLSRRLTAARSHMWFSARGTPADLKHATAQLRRALGWEGWAA